MVNRNSLHIIISKLWTMCTIILNTDSFNIALHNNTVKWSFLITLTTLKYLIIILLSRIFIFTRTLLLSI